MTATEPPADGARVASASAAWALGLCTAVGWFFFTAAGFATGPLQALPWLFLPGGVPNPLLIAVLGAFAVLGFVASMLPLGARWGREELGARAALGAIVTGAAVQVLLAAPAGYHDLSTTIPILAMTAAFVATAAGALFLNAVIGLVNRRAVAGGVVGALLLRHAARPLPGRTLIEQWDVVAVALAVTVAAAGLFCLARWRAAPPEDRTDSFERRAGGLRLRGALALGVLLYFELTYGLPGLAVVDAPHAGPAGRALAGALGVAALALAWLFVVRGLPVPRHRSLAVTLSLVLTLGALYPHVTGFEYRVATAAAVLAQCAAFLLLGRALAPASGRRSGRKLATGLALFLLLTIAYAATFVTTQERVPMHHGRIAVVIVTLVAGVVLGVAMYLTPRPAPAPAPLPDRWLFGIAAALPLARLLGAFV